MIHNQLKEVHASSLNNETSQNDAVAEKKRDKLRQTHKSIQKKKFCCPTCKSSFKCSGSYRTHQKTYHSPAELRRFVCKFCNPQKLFPQKFNYIQHHKSFHSSEPIPEPVPFQLLPNTQAGLFISRSWSRDSEQLFFIFTERL